MKRKPLILAITLSLVVGAALWGVNYRLDHPPLTDADKEFRALVAGADEVQASQESCQRSTGCLKNSWIVYDPLNAAQTRNLTEQIRFSGDAETPMGTQWKKTYVRLNLSFKQRGKEMAYLALLQDENSGLLATPTKPFQFSTGGAWQNFVAPTHQIHPRFHKRLNRALDAYLPQRIRP